MTYMTPFEKHVFDRKNENVPKTEPTKLTEPRKLPWSSEVMRTLKTSPRADKPSPILEEYMKKNGMERFSSSGKENLESIKKRLGIR